MCIPPFLTYTFTNLKLRVFRPVGCEKVREISHEIEIIDLFICWRVTTMVRNNVLEIMGIDSSVPRVTMQRKIMFTLVLLQQGISGFAVGVIAFN
jgi:hypothetical protein